MDKYYTPTVNEAIEFLISENHIYGTIYESKDVIKLEYSTDAVKTLLNFIEATGNWSSVNGYSINPDILRIKYLDKEDIESFGFEKKYSPSYITDEIIELYSMGDKETWYNLEYDINNILITKCHVYNEITGNWTQESVFKGIIKNKSELKKILIQIGVIDVTED